jgi:restriction endonuclease S subunit
MNIESIINNFDVLTDSKNGVQRLRELIRDLAIKGQLIDNPDKSISGTVGSLSPLPSSWRWVKIEEVADFVNGFAFRSDEYVSKGVGVVRMSDMKNGEISPVGMKFVSADRLKSLDSNFQVKPNDIVMGMTGATLGKPCVNRTSEIFLLNQRIGKFVPKDIDPDYLLLALANLENSFMSLSFGTGVNNLSLLPLPPRGMQSEIVKAVGEMYKTCDKLEAGLNSMRNLASLSRKSAINAISTAHTGDDLDIAWIRIQDNWETITGTTESVESLRMLVLDLAIRGNLTSKTSQMIGPVISTQESPFSIPAHWKWCTLQEITEDLGQETPVSEFSYIDVASINNRTGTISEDLNVLSAKNAPSRARKRVAQGCVLFSTVRPYLRNIAIVNREFTPKAIASTAFAVLYPIKSVSPDFLFFCLRSNFFKTFVESKQKGVAYPAINGADLKSALLPIPPLAEQEQIIGVVTNLLNLCDQLEYELSQRSSLTDKFSRSITAITG